MPKANTNVIPLPSETTEPQMSVEDVRLLTGPLTREYEGKVYWTIRGRVISQLYKDAAFSAFAFKDENDTKPVHNITDQIAMLEGGTSPYKDQVSQLPELAHKKMRHDLVFDCLNDFEKDPEVIKAQCQAIKERAIKEWAHMKADSMGGPQGRGGMSYNQVMARIKAGAPNLTEVDESWDDAFITKAASFITGGSRKPYTFGEDDVSNLNLIMSVLAGRLPEQESGAVKVDDIAI